MIDWPLNNRNELENIKEESWGVISLEEKVKEDLGYLFWFQYNALDSKAYFESKRGTRRKKI